MNTLTSRFTLLVALLCGIGGSASAQEGAATVDLYERPAVRQAQIQIGGIVQRYTVDLTDETTQSLSQVAMPLFVAVPLGRDFAVSLHTVYASSSGDDLATLAGLADAQIGISYRQMLGPAEMVVSLGTGLPLGSTALSAEELLTAMWLSRNEFALDVPLMRQGFRFAPGVTFSVPLSPRAAFGIGASYQVRQSFTPFDDMDVSYSPGNEVLLTAGIDLGIGRSSVLSADVAYAIYGQDTFGDGTFEPGNAWTARLNVVGGIGRQEIHFLARYRHRSEATIGETPFAHPVTDEARVMIGGLLRFPGAVELGLGLGARYLGHFGEIAEATRDIQAAVALLDHQVLFDASLAPSVRVAEDVRLFSGFTYTLGLGRLVDIENVSAMAGIRAQLGLAVSL